MADGVDHIDIYADVEEEFNQVRFNLSIYTCLIAKYFTCCTYRLKRSPQKHAALSGDLLGRLLTLAAS